MKRLGYTKLDLISNENRNIRGQCRLTYLRITAYSNPINAHTIICIGVSSNISTNL